MKTVNNKMNECRGRFKGLWNVVLARAIGVNLVEEMRGERE